MITVNSIGLYTRCDYSIKSPREYKRIRKQLIKAFNLHSNAAAIASNQVLFNENGEAPAVFLYQGQLYINPVYENTPQSTPYKHREGCLSHVGHEYDVIRHSEIRATYRRLILRGNQCLIGDVEVCILRGFPAAVFQHETDHLLGICIMSQRS